MQPLCIQKDYHSHPAILN